MANLIDNEVNAGTAPRGATGKSRSEWTVSAKTLATLLAVVALTVRLAEAMDHLPSSATVAGGLGGTFDPASPENRYTGWHLVVRNNGTKHSNQEHTDRLVVATRRRPTPVAELLASIAL